MFNKLFRTSLGIGRLICLIIFGMNLTPAQAILVEWNDGSSFEPGTTLVARLCNYELMSKIPHDCSKDPYENLGMDTPTIVSTRMGRVQIKNEEAGDDVLSGLLAKDQSGKGALYIAVAMTTPTSTTPIWYDNSEEMTEDMTIVQEWLNETKVVKLTKPTTRK